MSNEWNWDDVIAKYLKLRSAVEAIKERHKAAMNAELGPLERAMEAIEAASKQMMEAQGQQSVKTGAGTAFITTKRRYKLADQVALANHVIDLVVKQGESVASAFSFFGKSVIKEAVTDYHERTGVIPPGVMVDAERVAQFRSPTGKNQKGEPE